MIERDYPGIEFVELDELQRETKSNRTYIEAKYLGDVAGFRASVVERLLKNQALHGNSGWLLYREPGIEDADTLVEERSKETLIIFFGSDTDDTGAPHIKIVSNTEYWLEDGEALLSEEVTVDREDDCQMIIGVAYIDQDGSTPLAQVEGESTLPMFFRVKPDNELVIANYREYTPIAKLWSDIERQNGTIEAANTMPFGTYQNLEDRLAALEWAKTLLQATDGAVLIASFSGHGEDKES